VFYQRLALEPALDRAVHLLLVRIVTGGPARLSALAEDQMLDLSTVSRQIAVLESAGYVSRTPDPADRRASVIAATEVGAEVFRRNRVVWLAAIRDLFSDWTPAERAEFARLLGRLNESIATRASQPQPELGIRPPAGAATSGTATPKTTRHKDVLPLTELQTAGEPT
jgi:DNA-binding MarR family transcriptional regulator